MKKQEPGVCPMCGKILLYEAGQIQDESFFYDVSCSDDVVCGWFGEEYYNLEFDRQLPIPGEDRE